MLYSLFGYLALIALCAPPQNALMGITNSGYTIKSWPEYHQICQSFVVFLLSSLAVGEIRWMAIKPLKNQSYQSDHNPASDLVNGDTIRGRSRVAITLTGLALLVTKC